MAKKQASKKSKKVMVAIRLPNGQIEIFKFPTSKIARIFADQCEKDGCQVLLGWGE